MQRTIVSFSSSSASRRNLVFALGCVLTVPFTLNHTFAQVPITPSGLNTQVNLSATPPAGKVQYDITGGTRAGGASGTNLFHSFGEFNVPTNNVANFLNETGLPTSNILGRVTGGNLSSIFGSIQTQGFGNANLFLMNPAGFLFGPNATINVGGMVAFTSADYLRLADGVRFNAVPDAAADALLSTAPVAAYGFLGSNPGAITVQGSQLTVTEGTGIALVGGNIVIESGTPDGGTAQPAQLIAPNGKLQLASSRSPGEFDAVTLQSLPNADGTSFTSFGSISLEPGSNINISGTNTASIRGGQFVLTVNDAVLSTADRAAFPETISLSRNSSIVTSNLGTERGADVQLIASNIQLDGASLQSVTRGDGTGGNISLGGQTVGLTNGAQIVSSTHGSGTGGNITVEAHDSLTISGFDSEGTLQGIMSPFTGLVHSGAFTETSSSGSGGNLTITADTVVLENLGTLFSQTTFDNGRGGAISAAVGSMTLREGGQITSVSGAVDLETGNLVGSGLGGDISVAARNSILVTGSNPDFFLPSQIFSAALNEGNGGNVVLSAPNISVTNGGVINTTTFGIGNGGNLALNASTLLNVSGFDEATGAQSRVFTDSQDPSGVGNAGSIMVTGGSISVADLGSISSEGGPADAGDITINIEGAVNITGGSHIASAGNGTQSGSIFISADTVLISGMQDLSATSIDIQTRGENAIANISVTARQFVLTDNARINSDGRNNGGNITISATESLKVSDGAKIRLINGVNRAASLGLSSQNILLDQGILQTESSGGGGDSGNVNLLSDNLTIDGGFINSVAPSGAGHGGDVTIVVNDTLSIQGQFLGATFDDPRPAGIYTSTDNSAIGRAGNVSILADTVQLTAGARVDSNTSTSAQGGAILIQANQLHVTNGAFISASSTGTGPAGSVLIEGTTSPAQSVLIDGFGSGIFTETQGIGQGGNITAWSNQLQLSNGSTISSKTSGSGDAGNILVKANDITIYSGATVTAASTGSGNAGAVTIQGAHSPANSILIDGLGSGVFSNTTSTGLGGSIGIDSNAVTMTNGAVISASSEGAADAGSIEVTANNGLSMQNSSITTEANKDAGGGNIKITTSPAATVQLQNSLISASVSDGPGGGGNVSIDPQYVILQNSQILAQAADGQGGSILITAGLFLPDAYSMVSADSGSGLNGNVTIQSPISQAGGRIQPLGKSPLIATSMFSQRCAALAGGNFSSFTVAGRDTLPAEPGSWLSSPLALATPSEEKMHQARNGRDTPLLSLRQIAPSGFLTQGFAVESSGCQS